MANFAIADTVNVVAGTGTLSSSGVNVTGTATNFNPELAVGSIIHAAGYDLVIATIADDTHATVVTAPLLALSGATFTITAMVNVETYSTPSQAPVGSFQRWVEAVDLGNALARSMGRPMCTWTFPNIDTATFAGLQALCTSKSARVYIRTLNDLRLGTYGTYQAAMIWLDDEGQYGQSNTMPFRVEFRDLILL